MNTIQHSKTTFIKKLHNWRTLMGMMDINYGSCPAVRATRLDNLISRGLFNHNGRHNSIAKYRITF